MSEKQKRDGAEKMSGFRSWVDARFGPVLSFGGFQLLPPEPAWWVYTCKLARAPVGNWYHPMPAGAAGTSIDHEEARGRAVGEAIERYSAMNAPLDGVPLTPRESEMDFRFPVCAPDEPCPPSFCALDPDVPLTHLPVNHLAEDREVLIPAAFAHLSFLPEPPEPLVALPISTGLAFQTELHGAIWSGLCEVAERDAMMMMWWQRRPLVEISTEDARLPSALALRVERLRRVGLVARLFDMTTDFRVPTIFCVIRGERYPHIVVGAATRADALAACAKALDEAVSARVSLLGRPAVEDLPPGNGYRWVRMLEHHVLVYAARRSAPIFDFLLGQEEPRRVTFSEFAGQPWWPAPRDMAEMRERASALEALDLTVLWADLTAPEATEFGHVVKVVVPQMLPLSQDHNARWLATPRLLRAAGVREATAAAFNPYPHPFA